MTKENTTLDIRAIISSGTEVAARGSSSLLVRFFHGEQQLLLKMHRPRPITLRRIRHLIASPVMGLPVEDHRPEARCRFERETLSLWRRHGFSSPAPADIPLSGEGCRSALVMEWVEGRVLSEVLTDASVPAEEKLDILRGGLSRSCRRHQEAVRLDEKRLIHFDSNTANVMLRGGELVHIDFEMGRLRRNIEVSAAVELFKFLRWAAGDMGSAMIGEVARIAVVEYASLREMIERHVRRVLSRPFGRRRHAAAAGSADVSVMAVAEALREAFSESR